MKISHRARRVTKKKKSLTLEKKVKYPTHDVTIATKILFVTIGSRRMHEIGPYQRFETEQYSGFDKIC